MQLIEGPLASALLRNWWALLLRGLAAIAFGILTWLQPGISLAALVLLFGIYVLADGILAVWAAITGRRHDRDWWVLLLAGLAGIAVGVLTFATPGITAFLLLLYIGVWAMVTGIFEIVTAIRLRKVIRDEWLYILGGLASVLFGAFLIARPGPGALALLWLIAAFAVAFGVILVVLAFKARGLNQKLATM